MPLVYDELRRLARRRLRGAKPDNTMQPTALVHEAYLRLCNQGGINMQSEAHFHALVAHVMRCVLVDYARRKLADKRQPGVIRLSAEAAESLPDVRDPDVMAVDEALTSLEAIDPEKSRIVELRFFGGLSVDEVALVTGSSSRTVARQWSLAKAWLYDQLRREG